FQKDLQELQKFADGRKDEIGSIVNALLALPDAERGREFIESLPREIQHVLVLLYFQVIDRHLAQRQPTLQ
ncbi:MAG: hypothetical protein ACRD1Z_12475, partial [Vicinamibacteria bacterium]